MDEQGAMIIGVAGGTGSGKTTLTKKLKERFGGDICVVYHDNYYKSNAELPFEERAKLNYDHPDAFETELLIRQLKTLRAGGAVECPVYDYSLHTRSRETVRIEPAPVILVEGILTLHDPGLRELMDIKIFVDCDADVRLLRRIKRDVEKRGRTLRSVMEQYLSTVKPMHDRFVEPSRRFADVVVPEGGKNRVALDLIERRIEGHLSAGQPVRRLEE